MKHLVVTLALVALPAFASAQSAPAPTTPAPTRSPPPAPTAATAPAPSAPPEGYRVEERGGRRVYVLDGGVVHGEVQRPYAFTVTGRSPLGYTALDERKTWVAEVVAASRRSPF